MAFFRFSELTNFCCEDDTKLFSQIELFYKSGEVSFQFFLIRIKLLHLEKYDSDYRIISIRIAVFGTFGQTEY